MRAALGQRERLKSLLDEIGDRPVGGPGTALVRNARLTLLVMGADPRHLYSCGPMALKAMLLAQHAALDRVKFLDHVRAGEEGTSLARIAKLGRQAKGDFAPVFRRAGQPVPIPSVVHWKIGHFGAILGQANGRYEVADPVARGGTLWVTPAALDAEASGYFLVPAAAAETGGWRRIAAAEAESVRGAGIPGAIDPNNFGPVADAGNGGNPLDPNSSPPTPCDDTCSCGSGMCRVGITELSVGVRLRDTPVGYRPPKGPSAKVTLTYNQYEADQPSAFQSFNIGGRWAFSFMSYIEDSPDGGPGVYVSRYRPDGGAALESGCSASPCSFTPEENDGSLLSLVSWSPVKYQRSLRDGTVETYTMAQNVPCPWPNGCGFQGFHVRLVFLSSIADPQGNTLNLNYTTNGSGQVLLSSVTDASGRSTTFSYGGNGAGPLQISQITDPFQRSAYLSYDAQGRLTQIQDVLGLASILAYDQSGMINSLTTPYGTTSFAYGLTDIPWPGGTANVTYLQITDPLGYREREEQGQANGFSNNYFPFPQSDAVVPQGMTNLVNQWHQYRDGFHWDAHQFVAAGCSSTATVGCAVTQAPPDSVTCPLQNDAYCMARQTHFTHGVAGGGVEWYTIESRKQPLENRLWYTYPGQIGGNASGSYDKPSAVGRVLDDGTTQLTQFAYNSTGNLIQKTDPVGRVTQLNYAAGGIDVTGVTQGGQTIAQYTWNSQHRPLTYTDAAGQTWHYGYNAAGQLTSATDPLGETTGYQYDGFGRLTTVVNANNATAASYTYDADDRVARFTDSEGWTASYSYDAADRVTQIAYPDGTTRKYAYTNLDLTGYTDRQGHGWSYSWDADRRLVSVTDPLGHATQYAYWENGRLKSLTDANGHTTNWAIDVEGRPTVKTYADGTQVAYAYEGTTSRLHAVADALGQTKQYSWFADDRLAGINYTGAQNPTPNVAFAYDPAFGLLTGIGDGTGTTAYSYVPVGQPGALQLTQETVPLPGLPSAETIAYTYDALGRPASRSQGGAPAEGWQYDALGRVSVHSVGGSNFALGWLGQTAQPTSLISGAIALGYLPNGGDRRLASINNNNLRNYAFTYNGNNSLPGEGLITAIGGSSPWNFSYDAGNRLTAAAGPNGWSFGYTLDPAGNIASVSSGLSSTNNTYNAVNELISRYQCTTTCQPPSPLSWDAAGNLVSDGSNRYAWDAENRLVSITYPNRNKTVFAYDGLGRRVQIGETAAGVTTAVAYLWCGGARPCVAYNSDGSIAREYYPEGEVLPASGQVVYTLRDQLGSTRDGLVNPGAIVQAYDYDPYGKALQTPNAGPLADFRYAGMFYHGTSGLYLTRFRAYSPTLGRWLSRDPLPEMRVPLPRAAAGVATLLTPDLATANAMTGPYAAVSADGASGADQRANLYQYVGANPINTTDPLGLVPEPDPNSGTAGSGCGQADSGVGLTNGVTPPTILHGTGDDGGDQIQVAASTTSVDYAARMLGYNRILFGQMVHDFKAYYELSPSTNLTFHDNGDVYVGKDLIGDINEFAP